MGAANEGCAVVFEQPFQGKRDRAGAADRQPELGQAAEQAGKECADAGHVLDRDGMKDAIEEHPHMLALEIALDRLMQGQRHIGEQTSSICGPLTRLASSGGGSGTEYMNSVINEPISVAKR